MRGSRKQGFKSKVVNKNFWKIFDIIYECPLPFFFTVDICEHLTNWWHKNPFEGASEKWFRKRRGTRNVSNYAWPWPIFVQCDTRCPFVLMIFERNSQKDSKEKKEIILISKTNSFKLFRWSHIQLGLPVR